MLHVDFAGSYKNDPRDTIQSAYFGNQCLSIFAASCYTKNPNNVRNENVIVAAESFDCNRVTSMRCLQNVVHKIEHMHEKTFENAYV